MSTEPMTNLTTQRPKISLAAGNAEHHVVRATSPAAVLNLVPHLLGFHPDGSVVIIGTELPDEVVRITLNCPLDDAASPKFITGYMEHAVQLLSSANCSRALVVAYGPESQVAPFVAAFCDQAALHHVSVPEALRTEGSRYWSYVCADPTCCPPEGTPFELTADPDLASLLPEGVSGVLQRRESLSAQVASVSGADAAAMRRATRQAEARVLRLLEQAPASPEEPSGHALVVHEGITAMVAAIQQYQGGGNISRSEAAWLTVSLRDIQIRDDAWSRMVVEQRKENLRLMLNLTRLARRGYVAPSATLLAFVAWQSGNGALANVALGRALAEDRDYSMADLIRRAVNSGLSPSLARVPMTPEQVAAEYAKRAAANRVAKA